MANELQRLKVALAKRYTIQRELGRGGMATVYLAHDLRHDRSVALKVLKPELTAALGPERFLREITLTARLDHPHILPLLDSGDAEGLLYYAMPYVEGESLRDRLNREKQLPLEDALGIAREVADGLSYAHNRGIVHRDIKPENILLAGGHARVADFGIARAVTAAGAPTLTETGLAIGTAAYMSPEQAAGDRALDARNDIYSLGCVVYEMLAGQPPFTGATAEAILARKSLESVPSLRIVREAVPLGVEGAIAKALAKVPADRFATAGQFAEAMENARIAPGSIPLSTSAIRSRRLLLAAVSVAVLGVVTWWAITRLRTASPHIDSLVVLPFDNLSRDPAQEYFVDGMHDAVIAELARLGSLKVISRMSAMRYRNTVVSPPAIARELSVSGLVEGTVLLVAGRVRITVKLIDGPSDRQLWANSYERDVREVLALQSEIAGAVAREIAVSLSPASRQRLELAARTTRAPSPDPEAYDAYLRGRYYMARVPPALDSAIGPFERAIAKDPAFALAQAALAEALWLEHYDKPEALYRAREAAQTALSLDRELPETHVALGLVRMADWDWQGSEAAFREAIVLNPNSSVAHQWYAQLLRQSFRLDEALKEAQRALDLDPLSLTVRTMVGWVLYNQHRYDEALERWQTVLDLEPEFGLAIYNQGLAYWMKGMGPEVIAAGQRAKKARFAMGPYADWLVSIGYALTGRHDRAKAVLDRLDVPLTFVAAVHHVLGADDKALAHLERALSARDPALPNDTSEPIFDRLRDHPRFRALRAAMHLP